MFLVVGLFVIVSAVLSNVGRTGLTDGSRRGEVATSVLGPGVSVIEMSVAMNVPNRDSASSILSVLNRLSNTARTDSRVGVQDLTSQVALELLRRKSYIVAAYARGRRYVDANSASREYDVVTVRERSKFQREGISRYGGVVYDAGGRRLTEKGDTSSDAATVAVITILMLIDGDSTSKSLSSKISSIRDVEGALSRIASDAKADECLRGAEILWTPEERDETLTMREVLADYPSLRSI